MFRIIGALVCVRAAQAAAAPLSTAVEHTAAIGRATAFLQEQQGRLEWPAALAAARAGRFAPGASPVLNFGIGADPTWIHFTVDNPSNVAAERRLSIETAWLDRIEVFVVQHGRLVAHHLAGDRLPYAARELAGRYFVFDPVFAPGASDVLIRVETPDPMVIPLYLQSAEAAAARQTLLLDIDHFKQINDRYGHAQGDAVLKTVAATLKQSVRQGDVLARRGSEEFIVFLPETGLHDATLLAERLRVSITALSVSGKAGTMAVTASIGIAERADHATLDALIAAADACLFESKQQGRNRVTGGSLFGAAAA